METTVAFDTSPVATPMLRLVTSVSLHRTMSREHSSMITGCAPAANSNWRGPMLMRGASISSALHIRSTWCTGQVTLVLAIKLVGYVVFQSVDVAV